MQIQKEESEVKALMELIKGLVAEVTVTEEKNEHEEYGGEENTGKNK